MCIYYFLTLLFHSSNIYDKRDDFDFYIQFVNFTVLDGDVPRAPSNGVSQLIRFSRVSSLLTNPNACKKKLWLPNVSNSGID